MFRKSLAFILASSAAIMAAPKNEPVDRIAAAVNALRPDWPLTSLRTYLHRAHADRAYCDLAVAAVAVATDPRSQTPARLGEHGPWWTAAYQASRHSKPPAVLLMSTRLNVATKAGTLPYPNSSAAWSSIAQMTA